jgi:hypothetical protein
MSQNETSLSMSPSFLPNINVTIPSDPNVHHDSGIDGYEEEIFWKDPLTHNTFVVDRRTGNSYPQGAPPLSCSSKRDDCHVTLHRRTLNNVHVLATKDTKKCLKNKPIPPGWIQHALKAPYTSPF